MNGLSSSVSLSSFLVVLAKDSITTPVNHSVMLTPYFSATKQHMRSLFACGRRCWRRTASAQP